MSMIAIKRRTSISPEAQSVAVQLLTGWALDIAVVAAAKYGTPEVAGAVRKARDSYIVTL